MDRYRELYEATDLMQLLGEHKEAHHALLRAYSLKNVNFVMYFF